MGAGRRTSIVTDRGSEAATERYMHHGHKQYIFVILMNHLNYLAGQFEFLACRSRDIHSVGLCDPLWCEKWLNFIDQLDHQHRNLLYSFYSPLRSQERGGGPLS